MQEHLRHGDLLQADFADSYSNLTLKSIQGLKFINVSALKVATE